MLRMTGSLNERCRWAACVNSRVERRPGSFINPPLDEISWEEDEQKTTGGQEKFYELISADQDKGSASGGSMFGSSAGTREPLKLFSSADVKMEENSGC